MQDVTVELKKHKTDPNQSVLKLNNVFFKKTPKIKEIVEDVLKEALKGTALGFKSGENSCMWFVPNIAATELLKTVNYALFPWAYVGPAGCKLKSEIKQVLFEEDSEGEDEDSDEDEGSEEEEEDAPEVASWPTEDFWHYLSKVCAKHCISELRFRPDSNLVIAINTEGMSVPWSNAASALENVFQENI